MSLTNSSTRFSRAISVLAGACLIAAIGWFAVDQLKDASATTLSAESTTLTSTSDSPHWIQQLLSAEEAALVLAADTKTTKDKSKKAAKNKVPTGKLNLNTATVKELSTLPGVGPSKAERVISWRTKNGNFARVLDLRRVKGFGKKSVDKLSQYLTVAGPSNYQLK